MRTIQTALAVLLLAFAAAASADELVDPDPISIPAGLDQPNVAKAIRAAMARTKWGVESEAPGRIVAVAHARTRTARVTIGYDDKQVRIAYLDSAELDYAEHDGKREISGSYNKWVKRLADDIAVFDISGVARHDPEGLRRNPPPSEMLSSFSQFELGPITMNEPYAGQDPNERAATKIEEYLQRRLDPLFRQWGEAPKPDKPRSLRIEPHIESITFISGGARYFAGALAGSSDVVLQLKLVDADSGQVIATPRFHRHSSGNQGFMGIADNEMLNSVASLAGEYVRNNYSALAGGFVGDPF